MTPATLKEYVYEKMPLRTRFMGRERLGRIVDLAISRWPSSGLMACKRGSSREEELLQGIIQGVEARYSQGGTEGNTYGFVWVFFMSAVVSAVVQVMLRWWLERTENRQAMASWKMEEAT